MESVISKFLAGWRDKEFVLGAILTGSRVTSFASKFSDIDIYIVLNNRTKWRERGNIRIDSELIEYFANPVNQIRKYFNEEWKKNKRITARMFAIGKILFDKTGEVKKLKKEAQKWMKKEFKRQSKTWVELSKYKLWDLLDSLKELKYRNDKESYKIVRYTLLNKVVEIYSKFLRVEIPGTSKLLLFFKNEKFRKEYKFKKFPDSKFVEMFLRSSKSSNLEDLESLVKYVLNRMGGFSISQWKIRSVAET